MTQPTDSLTGPARSLETMSVKEVREALQGIELDPEHMKGMALSIFGKEAKQGDEVLGRAELVDGRGILVGMRDAETARGKNPNADLTRFSTDCAFTDARRSTVLLYVPTENARPLVGKEGEQDDDFLGGLVSTYIKLQAMVQDQQSEKAGGARTAFGQYFRRGLKAVASEADQLVATNAKQAIHSATKEMVELILNPMSLKNGAGDEALFRLAEVIGCGVDKAREIAGDLIKRTSDPIRFLVEHNKYMQEAQ